jgi:hypothetical protein
VSELRLNLVSAEADRELDAIRRTIVEFENVAGLESVIAALGARARKQLRIELIDVIGHSSSRGFVTLGDWEIDDSPQTAASFVLLIRPLLQQLGVRTIRLLGCSTAETEQCRAAVRGIAMASRCNVLGTRRHIGWRDYARGGFKADDALCDASTSSP